MRVKLAYLVGATSFILELERLRSSGIKECRRNNINNNNNNNNNNRPLHTWLRPEDPAECLRNNTLHNIPRFHIHKV